MVDLKYRVILIEGLKDIAAGKHPDPAGAARETLHRYDRERGMSCAELGAELGANANNNCGWFEKK